ncbi:MAG: ABC transporter ATP-binding protein, partial [Anaerolineales bacterium]|nr:ABC transporter ATP-binding protein [Anaerolineales bacterium]
IMNELKRLRSFIWPYRYRFAAAMAFMLLVITGDLIVPWLFGQMIDEGLGSGELRLTLRYALLMVGVGALRAGCQYLWWVIQQEVGQDAMKDLRDALYRRLQVLSQSFYREMPTGEIMSRVTEDTSAAQEYLGWGFVLLNVATLSFLSATVLLFLLDWQLTLATMIPILLLAVVVWRYDANIGPAWAAERKSMGSMSRVLQEFISGIRVVKAFSQEPLETTKFNHENEEVREANLRRARIESWALPTVKLLIGGVFVILALVGVRRVMLEQITLGTFFSYQWYLWAMIWPLNEAGWLINLRRQALAATPRLFQILDAPVTIDDDAAAHELQLTEGRITFQDVDFAFPDEPDTLVLRQLNLTVEPGEVVAILGMTGSGKSSLLNLVPRFQDAVAGTVLIDGQDVRDVTLESLRRQIGLVPQESFLFSATIRDNIAYGRPDATDEAIVQAAKLAQAHEFIQEMERGYKTRIGERGVRLSGGQKQRLALARAILYDPAILLLDEAMSAVDTRTEALIQKALEKVMEGRTSLIIAQRLSTIKHADRIVVLKDGQVVEMGSHEELLALDGEYTNIYNLQYRALDQWELAVSY